MDCTQHLYCLECILQNPIPTGVPPTLKTVNDLVNQVADYYAQCKESVKRTPEVPDQFTNVLVNQNEKLEELSKHIEEQKKHVEYSFDELSQNIMSFLDVKKKEYLNELDKQLFNLRYWYIYLDKQIKKTYPTPDEVNFLFPTKEELHSKLQKLTNITQLTALVINLKEDLVESQSVRPLTQTPEAARKAQLLVLGRKLASMELKRPHFACEEDYDITKLREEIKDSLAISLEKYLILEDKVDDVTNQYSNPSSKILKDSEFTLIKSWLPNGTAFKPIFTI